MDLNKTIMIVAIIWGLLFCWIERYQVIPVAGALAYRLDRWSGGVAFLVGDNESIQIQFKK